MRRALLIALFLPVAAPGTLAAAPAPDKAVQVAKEHFQKGELHYKLGRFEEALVAFAAAYESKPLPGFLFNLGQCHRQLKNWDRAIFFFEGYLREIPAAKNKPLVEELLSDSRREQKKLEEEKRRHDDARLAEMKARASSPRELVAAPSLLQGGAAPAAGATAVVEDTTPIHKKGWFWGALGGGAAAVAGAVVLGVLLGAKAPTILPSGSLGTLDRRVN